MDNYITIFEKLLDIINWDTLKKSTYKLKVDYNTAKNHLKALLYFHLAKLDSLRDIDDFMHSDSKLKETIKSVSLGSLSNYNNDINYNVYVPIVNELISIALDQLTVNEKIKKFGTVKLIDSSTISMGKTYFKWAEFRSTKAGIKLHTKFNLGIGIPELIVVSNAKSHDKTKMKDLITESNCIYIFDKGYVDYKKFDEFSSNGIKFITRLKDNAAITEVSKLEISYSDHMLLDDSINIIEDTICYLGTEGINITNSKYRVITVVDSEGKMLTFVTNIFEYTSEDIAWLYKKRWDIELFFKWIKQNLKIKKFIGYSLNAVMSQVVSGIITFIMMKLVQEESKTAYGLLKIKRLIKHSLTKLVFSSLFSWGQWLGSS
jgi:hypothetical protein